MASCSWSSFSWLAIYWRGHNFANSNVHQQLAQQQITFPAKGSAVLAPAETGPYLDMLVSPIQSS